MQVLQLTRDVTDHKTKRKHSQTVYAISSLTVTDATSEQLARWLRGHSAIENRLHRVREVTYAEDPYSALVFAPLRLYGCIVRPAYKTSSLTNPILGCQLVCRLLLECIVDMAACAPPYPRSLMGRSAFTSLGATWKPRQSVET
jgi:hypothetical protein